MTLVLRSGRIHTARRVPIATVTRGAFDFAVTADAARYRIIGRVQALALAIATAPVTPTPLGPTL